MEPNINNKAWNFHWNFTQVPQSNLATPKIAINNPEVGTIKLVNPSPNWKAKTATCLVTPNKSDNGAMIGIVNAACPDPETTKKLKQDWKIYITQAENAECIPSIR